jgi:hypothetical protein
MATVYKILGQAAPTTTGQAVAAASGTYVVPASTSAVVSTITVCNVTAQSVNAYLHVVPSGGTSGVGNAILYSVPIAGNSVVTLTLGITLAAGGALVFGSGTASSLTFQAFGSEIS